MTHFDVFNGDADGICALHQLRLHAPQDSTLVTGVKRDISLLQQVQASAGDQVTVLDISLDKNREALQRLLDAGVQVRYFDHHFAGEIPDSPLLQAHIDTAAEVCTSLLVDRELEGRYRAWAVTAAFGDNLFDSARHAAEPLGLSAAALEQLKQLGTYINYNGYGSTPEDLHFHPQELYRKIQPYADPLAFIAEDAAYSQLQQGYEQDMESAAAIAAEFASAGNALFIFPGDAWARRVSGVYSNDLAQNHPNRAHALLTEKADGGYLISIRAPLSTREGADELCRQFPTGGGRKAAAGINHLPASMLDEFIDKFRQAFP